MMTNLQKFFSLLLVIAFIIAGCNKDETITVDDPCSQVSKNDCQTCTNNNGAATITDTCSVTPPSGDGYIDKSGLITSDETWTADNLYRLNGKVVVSTGVTLTIEPGTIIKGKEGASSLASALIVSRGGKIMAEGTAENPIILTSVLDNIGVGQKSGTNLDETRAGLWGGLVVLGSAPISSKSGDTSQIEGIPASDTYGSFGGDDVADNSGVIKYVSVRHGGALLGDDNEINGITFGGVGNGTVVENIEVVANVDDGIEFFGGSVNVTNALVWAQGDDAFDVDMAYSGTIDNYVSIAGEDSDHALEIDGPEDLDTNEDGKFTLINGTVKGHIDGCGEMIDFRSNAQGTVKKTYFYNFCSSADIEIDNDGVLANYNAGDLQILDNEFKVLADSITIEKIFADRAENGDDAAFDADIKAKNNTIVTSPTVGADVSVFSWTYTHTQGVF